MQPDRRLGPWRTPEPVRLAVGVDDGERAVSDHAFQQLSREHHHLGASRWPPTATLVATPYGTTARMLPALGAAINIARTAYRVVSSPIVPASVAESGRASCRESVCQYV